MKRLLLAVTLFLAATAAFAQAADRDVLLTTTGTLYTVEAVDSAASASGTTNRSISLSVQDGKTLTRSAVPETIENGMNSRPSLAFDTDSKTVFVFWLSRPANSLSFYLYLASYRDGKWQPAVAIDNHPSDLTFRANLRIGITRRLSQLQADNTFADVPALLVHCVWWEDAGHGEEARYALVSVDKGTASVVDTPHSLSSFVIPSEPTAVSTDFNPAILRHPAILDGPTPNSIDVVFGDTATNSFHRTTLRPVADGRLHIPVPLRGDTPIPGPRAFANDWTGKVTTIDGHDGRLVLANTTTDSVQYLLFSKGAWSAVKSLGLNEKFSAEAAFAALARMALTAE
jgi:hypothetical protein